MTWTDYSSKVTIADWTITAMGPNGQWQSPPAASQTQSVQGTSSGWITPNTITSTNVPTGYVWDAFELEVIPPVDYNGTYPDAEFHFVLDGVDMKSYQLIDGQYQYNMFPRKANTIGQKQVKLGFSLLDDLLAIQQGKTIKNLPLRATGLKIANSINIIVNSVAGWGQNSNTAEVPMRVILKGNIIPISKLSGLNAFWLQNNSFSFKRDGFPTIVGTSEAGTQLGLLNWGD